MADPFSGFSSVSSQGESWATIVPSDVNIIDPKPKAIYCGTAGTITLEGANGVSVLFTVPAGSTLLVRPVRVKTTGTTVTEITALN